MARPLITERTKRLLQTIAERAMQDTATLIRPRVVDDGAGGTEPDPAGPLRTNTPCMFLAVRDLPPGPRRDQLLEHGRYMLSIPLSLEAFTTGQVEFANSVYQVTWAPAPGALDVERVLALEDA